MTYDIIVTAISSRNVDEFITTLSPFYFYTAHLPPIDAMLFFERFIDLSRTLPHFLHFIL